MKLSEIRVCDKCDGPVGSVFYVVRSSLAIMNPDKANRVMGTAMMLGGHVALAEIMTDSENAIVIAGDKNPELMDEFLLCQSCYMASFLPWVVEAKKDKDKDSDE